MAEKPEWIAQMEGVLESLNEGVMIVDDCSNIVYANETFLAMTQMSAEQVVGRSGTHFYEGADVQTLLRMREKSIRDGHNRFEFFVPRPDGVRIPVVISSRALEDLDGRIFGVLTFTDISEQKRTQEQLRSANEQLRQRAEEIEHELSLASRVQQTLAPKSLRWGRIAVDTAYLPMRTVGGDFGLVAPHDDGHLNLLVSDVSGHGISSALVANRIYTESLSLLERGTNVGELLRQLNHFVVQQIRLPGSYFTMALAQVARDGAHMHYASGGHPPALWLTPAGEVKRLNATATILGLLDEAVPAEATIEVPLSGGERVVLYTDGLLEVFDKRGAELGIDGFEQIARRHVSEPLAEMKESILRDVEAWRHGPATDDISLVVFELT